MLGTSWPEYIFIRITICGLRLVAPLSITYLASSAYFGKPLFSKWLAGYAACEAAFYLLVFLPRRMILQKAAVHPALPPREKREQLFSRCFEQVLSGDHATGWFFGASPETIKRDNMVEWLLWALFGVHPDGLQEEWIPEIDNYISRIERVIGGKLEDGRDDKVRSMRITLDPVDVTHRPIIWYLLIAVVDTTSTIDMRWKGFQHHSGKRWLSCFPPRPLVAFAKTSAHPDLVYWYRPHRSTSKDPILFIHGIGVGLLPYIPFLAELAKADPSVGIIALELVSLSAHMATPPLPRVEMLSALDTLLDAYGFHQVALVTHSYGTIIGAHILRDPALSSKVSSFTFIDPIPFMLHLPAIAYNFVYRAPRTANQWQLWYFASRDPDVARALARHFFWAENILWKEDLEGRRVAVILSGNDQIVASPEVWRYLTGLETMEVPVPRDGPIPVEGDTDHEDARVAKDKAAPVKWRGGDLQVLYYPTLDHAQVFDSVVRRQPLLDIIEDFTRKVGA